jgi:nicotinamide mononucleotide transporter
LYRLLNWLFTNYIEVLASVTGLIYLVYSIRGKMILWLFGLITSLLYVWVFFKSGIYADMGINVYYVIVSIYGWYHWKFGKNATQTSLPIRRLNQKAGIILLLVSGMLYIFILLVLKNFTDSTVAAWDAFITAFSITATWMLARKILEHWLIWIVVDFISVGLYIFKDLYPTVLLFIVYTILAFTGYKSWLKEWKKQPQNQ